MISIYYDSTPEISTASESASEDETGNSTDSEVEDDLIDSEAENELSHTSKSDSSSSILTRSSTNESFDVINQSTVSESIISNLTGMLKKPSLVPKTQCLLQGVDQTNSGSGAVTPQLYTLEDAIKIIAAGKSGVVMPQLYTLEEARKIIASEKRSIAGDHVFSRAQKVLKSNESKINDDPRGFGGKFICLCIAAAFGGKKGIKRYDRFVDITSIVPRITDCANRESKLNTNTMGYIGHVILYHWGKGAFKKAMHGRFGRLIYTVAKNEENICSEIGAPNLWLPKVCEVSSVNKKRILQDHEVRFQKNLENFKMIMLFFGIEL